MLMCGMQSQYSVVSHYNNIQLYYIIYSYWRCSEEHFKIRLVFNTPHTNTRVYYSSRLCTDVRPDAIAKLKAALPGTGAAYTVDEHVFTDVRPDVIAKLKAALPGTAAAYTIDEHAATRCAKFGPVQGGSSCKFTCVVVNFILGLQQL